MKCLRPPVLLLALFCPASLVAAQEIDLNLYRKANENAERAEVGAKPGPQVRAAAPARFGHLLNEKMPSAEAIVPALPKTLLVVAGNLTADPAREEPAHLKDVLLLLENVQPRDTSYRHKNGVVRWKGSDGATSWESHTDCSGLVDALLAHSYGFGKADLKKWFDKDRPQAEDYHDAIEARRGFTLIKHLTDARPGDLLAVKYPPGGENTGHLMIVAGPPQPMKEGGKPEVEGTGQWEVPVIDSSRSGHGKTDTRHLDKGKYREGLGQGVLRIYTHKSGDVAGYTWSTWAESEYYDQKTRHLVIGRIDAGFKP